MVGWYSEQLGVCRRVEQLGRSVGRGGEADDNTDDTLSSFLFSLINILACLCVCAHIFAEGICVCVCVRVYCVYVLLLFLL